MHARDRLTVLCSYRYKSMYSTSTATDRAWVEGECCQNVQKYQYVLLVHLHRCYKKKEEKKKAYMSGTDTGTFFDTELFSTDTKHNKKNRQEKKREEVKWINFKRKEMSDSNRG